MQVLLSVLVVMVMMFGCMTSVFAAPEDETEVTEQITEQQTEVTVENTEEIVTTEEPSTSTEEVTEADVTEETTEMVTEAPSTEATEATTTQEYIFVEETTAPPVYDYTEAQETEIEEQPSSETNPWDFEIPTEGTIEAEQSKADYFTGTVMWSAVGGGLLILLIMFIGKRKS